jgi:hypothetical protein
MPSCEKPEITYGGIHRENRSIRESNSSIRWQLTLVLTGICAGGTLGQDGTTRTRQQHNSQQLDSGPRALF